jgi:hypothetical protein
MVRPSFKHVAWWEFGELWVGAWLDAYCPLGCGPEHAPAHWQVDVAGYGEEDRHCLLGTKGRKLVELGRGKGGQCLDLTMHVLRDGLCPDGGCTRRRWSPSLRIQTGLPDRQLGGQGSQLLATLLQRPAQRKW